jgi:hypothetical protein
MTRIGSISFAMKRVPPWAQMPKPNVKPLSKRLFAFASRNLVLPSSKKSPARAGSPVAFPSVVRVVMESEIA